MQFFRRISLIRLSFRFFSSTIVNVTPSTTQQELHEIAKLMKNYNNSHVPIRTYALFQWMLNISNLKPDFTCYLHIIRACSDLNNLTICQKIHRFIEQDQTLQINEYRQLQIKLIYMYAKMKNLELSERLFNQIRAANDSSFDPILYGTMFKAYNINGQAKKTIELYEHVFLQKKSFKLDDVSAICVLNACSDCRRLDIGEYVHNEVRRLKLLDSPDIRLATSIIEMYCNCDSIARAHELFNQLHTIVDRVAYSTLMRAYLAVNQPVQILDLFKQFQLSTILPDSEFYLNVINTGNQLALRHQAENIHRSIPRNMIEKDHSLQTSLINMHAHCLHLDEAQRLFQLLKSKDNYSLASLMHGYAINGQGKQVLQLFREHRSILKFNEQVYKMVFYACALTGGLVREARELYRTMSDVDKTPEVAAAMVSTLARASLFDEVQSFIDQYQSTSQHVTPLWSAFFIACYHSGNVQYAKMSYENIENDPLISLLFSDLTKCIPSNEVMDYFRHQKPGICWTEIPSDDNTGYVVHEFHDTSSSTSDLHVLIDELKEVDIDWEPQDNDLKELFCGHTALRLAIARNLVSTLPTTSFQLTQTKSICSVCHEGMKQLTLRRQHSIILRDCHRVHHFHHGRCTCRDQF